MKHEAPDMKQSTGGFRQTVSHNGQEAHTEDIQDIIGMPPHALLRWGITWVLAVLLSIVALAAFIRYPDIVRTSVRINAINAPKAVVSRTSGNIVNLLVEENDAVEAGQSLAWMESTADHMQVLELLTQLYDIRDRQQAVTSAESVTVNAPTNLRLGELQNGYQAFYQSYLSYKAAIGDGIYLKRKMYIKQEIQSVQAQRTQLELQQELQKQEYALAEKEFDRYRQLAESKVISPSEFQQQQGILLAKQHPFQQTQSAMLSNEASLTAKAKELADLDNQINEEKSKFIQALNSLISQAEQWKAQYVLTAPTKGVVVFAGIIQRNQHIAANQEVLYINPESTDFFGEVIIPQYNMGKIKIGQEVLVKLNSYPFEEYGVLRGEVDQMTRVPYRDSIFLSKISLKPAVSAKPIQLATGMTGTAEIKTEDASLLRRILRNMRLLTDF